MKPLSVEMAYLLRIQNEIQAVWLITYPTYDLVKYDELQFSIQP